MADAPNDPAAGYYSGRPLNYDGQQAEATAPQARPQPAVGEQANALPVAPQPQPPPDAGEHANHTHAHGVPGYYKVRVNRTDTAAVPPPPPPAAVAQAPAPAPAPPAAGIEPEKEQSYIKKLLMCFKGRKDKK